MFFGRMYWRPNDDCVQMWDSSTGDLTTLTSAHPTVLQVFPAAEGWIYRRFGPLVRTGDGKILISVANNIDVTAYDARQFFLVCDADLTPTGERWEPRSNTYWGSFYGFANYEETSGVFDPATGLTWMTATVPGTPWEWNGFDNSGNWVDGRGNTELIPTWGNAYLGADNGNGTCASLLGTEVWRNGTFGDVICRYDLATDRWLAIRPQYQPGGPAYGSACHLAGTDETTGKFVTVNHDYNGGMFGWIELRNPDPAAEDWINPVPDGVTSDMGSHALGEPELRHNPMINGGPPAANTAGAESVGSNQIAVYGGKVYYTSDDRDNGINPDGTTYGLATSMYEMDLLTGMSTKLFDVPYHAFDALGGVLADANGPGWAAENYQNASVLGLTLAPVPLNFAISGRPLDNRRRFFGT